MSSAADARKRTRTDESDGQPRRRRTRFSSSGEPNGNDSKVDEIAKAVQAAKNLAQQNATSVSTTSASLQARAAALQQQIQQAAAAVARQKALLATSGQKPTLPPPLLLDKTGRQVDAQGNVIMTPAQSVATLKVNKMRRQENPYLAHRKGATGSAEGVVQDPRLRVKDRSSRGQKALKFVEEGTYIKKGENLRTRETRRLIESAFGAGAAQQLPPSAAAASIDIEAKKEVPAAPSAAAAEPKAAVGTGMMPSVSALAASLPTKYPHPVPDMEWWDSRFLPATKRKERIKAATKRRDGEGRGVPAVPATYDELDFNHCKTTGLIHVPVPAVGIPDKQAPRAIALFLTKKERKRIRRHNREQREQERRQKEFAGILPKREPRVTLTNLMRVLGEEAVIDPSTIERKVKEAMEERKQNHEKRNEERKLTPHQRREKFKRKMTETAATGVHVALFRVVDLGDSKRRWKLDINAKQLHLTGCILMCEIAGANLVYVEGGPRAVKKYKRLMLGRIKWGQHNEEGEEGEEEAENSESEEEEGNTGTELCSLLWQGVIPKRQFRNFVINEFRTPVAARNFLDSRNLAHYWDMVVNHANRGCPTLGHNSTKLDKPAQASPPPNAQRPSNMHEKSLRKGSDAQFTAMNATSSDLSARLAARFPDEPPRLPSETDLLTFRPEARFAYPIVTIALLLTTVAGYLVPLIIGEFYFSSFENNPGIGTNADALIDSWAMHPKLFVDSDQWYRMVIPIFLQSSIIQTVLNLLFIAFVVRRFEQEFGRMGFVSSLFRSFTCFSALPLLMVYVLSGLIATLASAVIVPNLIVVTSSAAILSVFGAGVADMHQNFNRWKPSWKVITAVSLYVVITVIISLTPFSNNFANVAGVLAGYFAGLFAVAQTSGPAGVGLSTLQTIRATIGAIVIVAAIALLLLAARLWVDVDTTDSLCGSVCSDIACVPLSMWNCDVSKINQ